MYLISKHFAHSRTLLRRPYVLVLLSLLLSGCALILPPKTVASKVSSQWQAPLPHQGALVQLRQWWQAQGDTLLVELQDAAQEASPGVAQATARSSNFLSPELEPIG
jgi:hypothetical protein